MNFKKYGVGQTTELKFKTQFGINLNLKKSFLNSNVKTVFNRLNKGRLIEKKLFTNIKKNIQYYQNNKCFRGIRHIKGLPVRGQRTHTNATPKINKQKNFL